MISNKTKYILILVGLLLIFTGCTNNFEETDIKETASEIKGAVLEDGRLEEPEEKLELIKKEGYYSLTGTSNYLDGLVAIIDDQIKLFDQQGENRIILDLETLGWAKETTSMESIPLLERKRLGLTENLPRNEIENYIVSQDKSKIALINPEDHSIKIHNFNNNKTTVIDSINISHIKKPYRDSVIFSPKSGYISLQILDEENTEGFISFGADSGNKVHDMIYGLNPQWNNQEQNIAFIHKDLDKVGVYQRRNRRINYLVELEKPLKVIGSPLWTKDDSTIYFTNGIDQPTNIQLVEMKNQISTRINEEISLQNNAIHEIGEVGVSNKRLVYSLPNREKLNSFRVTDLEGRGSTLYDDVDSFILQVGDKKKVKNFFLLEEGILYLKDQDFYLITDSSTHRILRSRGQINKIQYVEELKLLVFYIEGTESSRTAFLFL